MVAIKSKIDVLRALSSVIAKRAIFFFLIIDSVFLTLSFIGICLLVYFFSPWWWLLLTIFIPLFIASGIIYLLAVFIASRLYPAPLSREQRQHLQEFTDKILRLLETKGMGWWWFAVLCVCDLLLYRELRTLKEILSDTTSLKQDFLNLEREIL
jgi:hypothetical protein